MKETAELSASCNKPHGSGGGKPRPRVAKFSKRLLRNCRASWSRYGTAAERRQMISLGRQPADGSESWPRPGIAGHRPLAGGGASRRPKAVRNPRIGARKMRDKPLSGDRHIAPTPAAYAAAENLSPPSGASGSCDAWYLGLTPQAREPVRVLGAHRAQGSCGAQARRDEEVDVRHRRRVGTKPAPATPLRPEGYGDAAPSTALPLLDDRGRSTSSRRHSIWRRGARNAVTPNTRTGSSYLSRLRRSHQGVIPDPTSRSFFLGVSRGIAGGALMGETDMVFELLFICGNYDRLPGVLVALIPKGPS